MPLTEQELERKLATVKTKLVCEQPFIATIVLRRALEMPPEEWWGGMPKTMCTDGNRIYCHPEFIEKMSKAELVGVLAHEAYHIAGLHPWRKGSRQHWPWNIACDQVVNKLVAESGFSLPKDCVPATQDDKSVEELYAEMPTVEVPCGGGGDGEGGEGDQGDAPDWGYVIDPRDSEGKKVPQGSAEHKRQQEEAKILTQQAVNSAKAAGKLPAGLARWLKEVLEPKAPWREILARFVDGHSRDDYSWSRPNRRFQDSDFVMPTMWSDDVAQIVLACDTSGSISEKMLQEIGSEVIGCMEMYQKNGKSVELLVLWCDYDVYPQVVSDERDLKPQGGGGTSFAPVFKYLRDEGVETKAIVYVTDGYCWEFGEEPDCEVLWMLTAPLKEFEPPFGEIVHVFTEY